MGRVMERILFKRMSLDTATSKVTTTIKKPMEMAYTMNIRKPLAAPPAERAARITAMKSGAVQEAEAAP